MNDINPYATPRSWGQDNVSTDCTREGKYVIVPIGSDLPPRCIKCNAPALTPVKKRTVYWHHPGFYLLILINIVVYAVVALAVRKKAKLSPGLCQEHTTARKRKITLLLTGALLMMIAPLFIRIQGMEALGPILIVLSFIPLVMAVVSSQLVVPSKITKTDIKLRGCKEPFLQSLE